MSMKEKSHKENKKQKCYFENINKVAGTLRGLIKKRGENSQCQEWQNRYYHRSYNIENIITVYHGKFFINKFDNFDKMTT